MSKKLIHSWLGTNPLYEGYTLGNVCLYSCQTPTARLRRIARGIDVVSTCQVSMIPHYLRKRQRAGQHTVWHNQKPYWLRNSSVS